MEAKIFKTLDEQIEILKSKGLVVNDIEGAKEILFKENYFFVSGYRGLFMKDFRDRKFITGTTFEEMYAMFLFDRNIRNIMFKNILIVENNIKSIISYQLSKKYGFKEKDYLNPKNFTQDSLKTRQVKDVLNKMKRQVRVNVMQHSATLHYVNNYGYVPLWVLVKVLSFGIISELYCILKPDDQFKIADVYNLDVRTLEVYLSILANFRNLCAHEDILFDHRTQRRIPNDIIHAHLSIPQQDGEYIYGKNDLFAVVIIMQYMLSHDEFHDFMQELDYEIKLLDAKIDVVPLSTLLNKFGFPENWKNIMDHK
ncbi:MAG: Abi family protein [Firmicutes bacterium]|nr:Abi family protein [Bacillota bacterium]